MQQEIEENKWAETLVLRKLQERYPQNEYKLLADVPMYRHFGDIAIKTKKGTKWLDVKHDAGVSRYGNIYCEEQSTFNDSGITQSGWMYSHYDYIAVVTDDGRIVIIDFAMLKAVYKQYRRVYAYLGDAVKEGYIVPLSALQEVNAVKTTIYY